MSRGFCIFVDFTSNDFRRPIVYISKRIVIFAHVIQQSMKLIELNMQRIIDLCRKHRVKTLAVFGSILTDRFNDQSDVDLLVDFDEEITYHNYADNFFDLYHALRNLFGREVDLVDASSVKNPYFKEELDETKQMIYG